MNFHSTPIVPVHELPQDPVQAAPFIEEPIFHAAILPDAVNMNHVEVVAFENGLQLLPQAPAPLLGSLLGLQGLQDAQEI
ncbi:hypothetical protein FRC12_006887 [Ceratobasidium sp. 428]|nr:hypothetical protein FRC12_006887 [Ceratobasidium sp. 428]